MNYQHLTIEERACIYQFTQLGMTMREIGKALNRNVGTISRELKRNSYYTGIGYYIKRYSPTNAHNKYTKRRANCHRIVKIIVI